MDFWSRMLSTIADTVLPENLDDDTLLLQMDEALHEEKASGIRSKIFWILVWAGTFKINGTRHIVLLKRKQKAYYFLLVCPGAKFAV